MIPLQQLSSLFSAGITKLGLIIGLLHGEEIMHYRWVTDSGLDLQLVFTRSKNNSSGVETAGVGRGAVGAQLTTTGMWSMTAVRSAHKKTINGQGPSNLLSRARQDQQELQPCHCDK